MLLLQWCSGLPGWGFLFSLTCLVFGKIMDTCSWKQTSKSSILLLELSGAYIWSVLFTYMYIYILIKFNTHICILSRHLNQHQDSHPSYPKHASSVSTSLAMGYDSNRLNLHLSPLHCSSHGPKLDRPPAEMTGWKGLIFSVMANEQTWISIGIMLQSSHQMSVQFPRII